MEKVYLETSLVSYLVARRSRDLIVAARVFLQDDYETPEIRTPEELGELL